MNEPRPLQFVDTNVLVYAHDISAGPKHVRAEQLVRDLWKSGARCLSVQVLQEFYVTITRKVTRLVSTSAVDRKRGTEYLPALPGEERPRNYRIAGGIAHSSTGRMGRLRTCAAIGGTPKWLYNDRCQRLRYIKKVD